MLKTIDTQKGLSLLEVLVAFSIFALNLGIIFQVYSKGARSTVLNDEYARAVIIAQSKLASIGIEEQYRLGEFTGVENGKYQWITRINISPDNTDELENNFNITKCEVEVEVSWNSFGKTRIMKLNTIKLIPII